MQHAVNFEEAAKKSWQSFTTMKRFVSEASRLENASWRLWFMQRQRGGGVQQATPLSPPGNVSNGVDAMDAEVASPPPPCVYCEIQAASLRCHGCCHDAYCVSCFKLIHKKGNLATHTATKVQTRRKQDGSRSPSTTPVSPAVPHDTRPSAFAPTLQSEQGPSRASDSSSHTEYPASESTQGASKVKLWEIQMDILLQRLMANSIHSEEDISVHNIDGRGSLDMGESVSSFLSDITESSTQAVFDDTVSSMASAAAMADLDLGAAPYPSAPKGSNLRRLDHVHSTEHDRAPEAEAPPVLTPSRRTRKKSASCANCSGDHIMIDCPLLQNSVAASSGSLRGSFVNGGGGVDTVLRKCFTTIHNDNLSNSTHAFLGDEISVRGGNHFGSTAYPTSQFIPSEHQRNESTESSSSLLPAGYNHGMISIDENQSAAAEDMHPVLLPLSYSSTEAQARRWNSQSWLLSCLATDLPSDVYEALRSCPKRCVDPFSHCHPMEDNCAWSGWVYMKTMGQKWCKRFVLLSRNVLWEFLDERDCSRPIGYANLSEGSVHSQQKTKIEFIVKYFKYSSAQSPRNECWFQCESMKEATVLRQHLERATQLKVEDLFDLTPDGPGFPMEHYELGKGRFSLVQRVRRRRITSFAADKNTSVECALKVVDKEVFWNLVAKETEREDTLVREILTQALLTARCGGAYCPVIQLLSVFETRQHLVMELELMHEGDLHEEIVANNAVSESHASYLVASLVRAIDYCQRNGVAHRDLKLSNLAIDASGNANGERLPVLKIADFGMATFAQRDGKIRGRCGTPGFVAPEILTAGKGEAYPLGVDMFSAGVVAYTMLCGYEPFFGVTDEELIQMNKAAAFEFEDPEWTCISDEAKDLITKMMEKDIKLRITPAQALQHPFLRAANIALDEALRMESPLCRVRFF